LEEEEWRKIPTLLLLRRCPSLLGTCSPVGNECFSLFFLFEQGSGPSIALAETSSGKLALLGRNWLAWIGTRSGSAPSNPPVVGR
jgi:hypothetical protein